MRVGDVALDLAQGRPVQVVDVYEGDAEAWSEENNYELTENYGNARLDADPTDAVYDCVYVGSIKNEPSKSYAFPESRLARVEVDAVDAEMRRPAERVEVDVLAALLTEAHQGDWTKDPETLAAFFADAGFPADIIKEARELTDAQVAADGGVE